MRLALHIAAFIAAVCWLAHIAAGQDWTDADRLDVARCVMAESDHVSDTESAAIAWVLAKRARMAGVTTGEMARRYCALFNRRSYLYGSDRSTRIRQATESRPPYDGERCARRWAGLQSLVYAFSRGEIADPCPAATHFGGAMDLKRIPANWRAVCGGLRMRNFFFEEVVSK